MLEYVTRYQLILLQTLLNYNIVALLFLGGYQVRCCIEEIKAYCFTKRSMYAVMYLCLLGGIIASIPLLIGMLKHVIAMGDGMLYVDGVTIFGQALPNDFLGCLNNNTIYLQSD